VPNGFGHDRVRSVFVGIRYVLNDAKSYLEPLDVATKPGPHDEPIPALVTPAPPRGSSVKS
jgi:hypothetical protein